ncbi:MAG: class I mannose-6-phosphate isomerase, partial [Abditibacteriota bacterium]|nr:class I mannose-6-phosphate isomerase [Abditibacteriota bacterium]
CCRCASGAWSEPSAVRNTILERLDAAGRTAVVEFYPGVNAADVTGIFRPDDFDLILRSDDFAVSPEETDAMIAEDLTDDPVFGYMTRRSLRDFFPEDRLRQARRLAENAKGRVLIAGVGASLISAGDICIMADITRWEIQLRYRRGLSNWNTAKSRVSGREKYKRGFFAEWRWGDEIKDRLLGQMDLYLDCTREGSPVLVNGDAYRAALARTARKPFRLVPYYDPGVWGGDWMKNKFCLPDNGSNYAWSFDGVPEENSLIMDFGGIEAETPAMNLILTHAREILGEGVFGRFGREFPIRFDMLDTIHGQNLSLQVHPLTEYIQKQFGMHYTQDESYYLLDTDGSAPCVYLGIKTGTDPDEMLSALRAAQEGGVPFDADKYVNRIPVKKHDHVLIPAGTVHCSGAGSMVLEISATPYIFTFKLWDWGRVDLDGKPRPIHIDHGAANIQWDRDTEFVKQNLIGQTRLIAASERGVIEKTGLDRREFIDTFRLTTSSSLDFSGGGSVTVANLTEGGSALLESPEGLFEPFPLHYAETCIIPEAAGDYRLVSPAKEEVRLIAARVRVQ